MFSQTWKKYLQVIALLIKRTAVAEQTVTLNHTDFERAAGGRKIKYSFTQLQLNKGRINTDVKHSPFAKEFSVVLQEDETLQRLISVLFLEFSLNNQFLLTIKNIAPVAEVVAPETAASEEAADTMDKEPEEIT
ncbi:MAG: hypothetical protein H7X88_07180, partial [Gloeobacteraceae cyanobacterium ES-bin-316]|nr:hypothetical protein [Ferruginibacter sp.]